MTHYNTIITLICIIAIMIFIITKRIFRYYPQTEVTLMCTEHFLMIRYKQKLSYSAVYYVLSNATLVLSIITIMTVIHIILDQRISRHIYAFLSYTLHCFLGIAVRTPGIGRVDLCSSPMGGSNLTRKYGCNYIFLLVLYYTHYTFYARYFTG